jgi:nitroimidazol reductase NimA-like FMN-containing flavoprotein (pyridoxamine 5'-phosphate oxidase superfamily)
MSENATSGPPTPRTKVRRLPDRGRYDAQTVAAILDEGFVCHLGVAEGGTVRVVPTNYGRIGDWLYLHGAVGNASLKGAIGTEICVTVTLVDGLVLARSAFHHSVNYRSVTIYGTALEVTDSQEKSDVLDAVVEHIVPGRTADARRPNDSELRQTRVIKIPIGEASAKVRFGGPKDDEEDMDMPIWAGHLPMRTVTGPPVPEPDLLDGVEIPTYVSDYERPTSENSHA